MNLTLIMTINDWLIIIFFNSLVAKNFTQVG
jgi:hypothetical protein